MTDTNLDTARNARLALGAELIGDGLEVWTKQLALNTAMIRYWSRTLTGFERSMQQIIEQTERMTEQNRRVS